MVEVETDSLASTDLRGILGVCRRQPHYHLLVVYTLDAQAMALKSGNAQTIS